MGRNKELKKMRKYARKEEEKKFVEFTKNANEIYEDFKNNLSANDYLKPKPKYFPKFAWNWLVSYIVKK